MFEMEFEFYQKFINETKYIMFSSPWTNSLAGRLDHTKRFTPPT